MISPWKPPSDYVIILRLDNDIVASFRFNSDRVLVQTWFSNKGPKHRVICRVLQAGKLNFEKRPKTLKMTFLSLKMIIFDHFSRILASFKISYFSLQHPSDIISIRTSLIWSLWDAWCDPGINRRIYISYKNGVFRIWTQLLTELLNQKIKI